MKKLFSVFVVAFFFGILLQAFAVFAQMPEAPPTTGDWDIATYIAYVVKLYGGWGGFLTWQAKVVAIIFVICGALKVSALRPWWDKLGAWKAVVAPFLALIASLITAIPAGAAGGAAIFTIIFTTLTTGAGAHSLSDLFAAIKTIPGIGSGIVAVLEMLQQLLGGREANLKVQEAKALAAKKIAQS